MMNRLQDRILGSMVGGAVGDALGYTVEFMDYERIIAFFGPSGITRYELNTRGVAEVSDDTQMTLFTANGILNALGEPGKDAWPGNAMRHIGEAYKEWYQTQTSLYSPGRHYACELMEIPELYSRRAPGNTCLSALQTLVAGGVPDNNSKGCGGIMRVAPVALLGDGCRRSAADNCRLACDAAEYTHRHPLGYLPAGMMAFVLTRILEAANPDRELVEAAVREAIECLRSQGARRDAVDELSRGSELAVSLADSNLPDIDAIRRLGAGWVGEEAWYIALYCTLRHSGSFEDAVVAAVNHSGDSDSTGAVTGNLIGALLGYSAIPACFKENLEHRELIESIANRLYKGKPK